MMINALKTGFSRTTQITQCTKRSIYITSSSLYKNNIQNNVQNSNNIIIHNVMNNCHKRHFSMHHQIAGRKRFYKKVEIIQKDIDGKILYGVTLDGRSLKTPARNNLYFDSELLALAIASEWDSQTNVKLGIQPQTMPFMSLASTAIDNLSFDPLPAQITCLSFLPTDSLLFFTNEDAELLAKQKEVFEPIIKWFENTFDVKLNTSLTMTSRLQHPDETALVVKSIVDKLDPYSLTCLQSATMECKSIVLAFAYLLGHIDIHQATLYSRMEEEHQLQQWGLVEGGQDMDRLNNSVSLCSTGMFFNLYHQYTGELDLVKVLTADSPPFTGYTAVTAEKAV